MQRVLALLVMLMVSMGSWGQSDARPEVLVLGTFHMANPGRDVFNTQADDVLAPKRQKEIAELIAVLKRFHPTKIAIESEVGSKRVEREYGDYLAGKYTLTANEIDQIGYRLAKELGHKRVYPVDVDGDFPLLRVINYAKANGRSTEFERLQAGIGARVKKDSKFLLSHTVLETLEHINSDEAAATAITEYFAFIPFGERWEYAGPDLLAAWYQRNIRIYHHIRKLAESPNDRVLVIYGSGHLGWLRQNVSNDATVKLVKLADLTGVPKSAP